MKLDIVLLLFYSFIVSSLEYRGKFYRYFSNYRECPTYVSQCVPLPQCPPIAWDLYHTSSFSLALIILKDNMCGIEQGMLKVCCLNNNIILDLPSGPEDNPVARVPTASTNMTSTPSSIRSHPNFQLINRNCGSGIVNRIAGGEASIPGEFPWMAILQYNDSGSLRFLCGGSLITDMYILTAAHCLTFRKDSTKLIAVRLGEYDVSTENDCTRNDKSVRCAERPRDYLISEQVLHPQYNEADRRYYKNDIALIRLSERVHPSGSESTILLKVDVPYVDSNTCSVNLRGRQIQPGQFCAGGTNMSPCNGDSGGPLVAKLSNTSTPICYQVGIVSIGLGSCLSSQPSIYTNVEDYLLWILDNIRD
ncbi:Melanization protease 1 [Blattella germanica]|nr:Melanization protease 1 [Blattella germanica]